MDAENQPAGGNGGRARQRSVHAMVPGPAKNRSGLRAWDSSSGEEMPAAAAAAALAAPSASVSTASEPRAPPSGRHPCTMAAMDDIAPETVSKEADELLVWLRFIAFSCGSLLARVAY